MLDIVSVFCARDISMQLLQARSIARHFRHTDIGKMMYVWNHPSEPALSLEQDLREALDGIALEVVHATGLGVTGEQIEEDGWITQQVLKLLAGRLVTQDRYLVLDAKNHFVSASSQDDFVTDDGRGVFPLADMRNNESWQFCLDYFGVARGREADDCVENVTPFLLRTSLVTDLMRALEDQESAGSAEIFLRHRYGLCEFTAYQAYFLSTGGTIPELFVVQNETRDVAIWGNIALDESGFETCLAGLERDQVKTLSLHWMACCLLSTGQKQRLIGLWRERGLVASEEEGFQIMASVVNGLTDGNRRYLQSRRTAWLNR